MQTARIDGRPGSVLSEADISVDPKQPHHLIVVSRDFAGVYRTIDAYYSRDGGAHYSGGPVIAGRYLGAPADASDPVSAYGDNHDEFLGGLIWRYPRHGFDGLIGLERSTDARARLGRPVVMVRAHNQSKPAIFGEHPGGSTTYDKEWIAVDRTGGPRHGTLYAAWVRFHVGRTNAEQSVVQTTASTDGGKTFRRPVRVSATDRLAAGPRVVVAPDGTVLVVWSSFHHSFNESLVTVLIASSRDGGRTFSRPSQVGTFRSGASLGPASGARANELVALDASSSGDELLCWAQAARPAANQTACVRSPDGTHWSAPLVIAPGVRGVQGLPQVTADGAHGFDVTFYAERRSSTDVLLARSRDGGRSFQQTQVLAHRPYRLDRFVGDYTGLAAIGGNIFAAYVLPRRGEGSPNSVYVTIMPS